MFGDYAISSHGRVKRITVGRSTSPGAIVKNSLCQKGYYRVTIKRKVRMVHTLVLETFVGQRPQGKEARHLDDNKINNRIRNLVWGTREENNADRAANGRVRRGRRHWKAKLVDSQIVGIRDLRAAGFMHKEIAAIYSVGRTTISKILSGKNWKCVA